MPTRVIYADSLLLVNFSMDFLALFVTAKLSSRTIHGLRMAGAAALGAGYGLTAAVADGIFPTLVSAVLGIVCALVMTMTAFGGTLREIMRAAVTFCAANIGLGGVMTALYSFVGRAAARIGFTQPQSDPASSPLLFMLIALISGGVSLVYGRLRKNKPRHAEAKLRLAGKERTIRVLCDSGNLLNEPISGRPAVIVTLAAVSAMLSETLTECAEHPERIPSLPPEEARRVRLLTAGSVTGQALMLGILPDRFECEGREADVCLAIDVKSSDYDGCSGIIPEILMK